MKDRNYMHSIQININKCIGCFHCMRVCSTQAIRIVDGHASIQPERCIDCGACGAPDCKNLAEDIVKRKATISHCVFVQRIMGKNYKLGPDEAFVTIEKIWGKGRLNKL